MGHYDECKVGYCPECGQAWGYCSHTKGIKEDNMDAFRKRHAKEKVIYNKQKAIGPDTAKESEKCREEAFAIAERTMQALMEKKKVEHKLTITITGGRGSGKSTLAALLTKYLAKKGNIITSGSVYDIRWKDVDPFEIEIMEKNYEK
jgi:DNA replication protein DnaC